MKKTQTKQTATTAYEPVAENVYQTGKSFRVRLTINGERYSRNFPSKRKAIIWRNELKRNANS